MIAPPSLARAAAFWVAARQGWPVRDRLPKWAIPQQRFVQVGGGEVRVGAGLAVEAEVPVAPRQSLDDGQGGVDLLVIAQAPQVDAGVRRDGGQLPAETVRPHLAEEGAAPPQLLQHGQHVAGRAAGVRLEQGVALPGKAVLGEVDQQLAQSRHVIGFLAHCAPSSNSRLYFSTSMRAAPSITSKLTACALCGV